jgi:hypothetical protein
VVGRVLIDVVRQLLDRPRKIEVQAQHLLRHGQIGPRLRETSLGGRLYAVCISSG